MINNRPFISDLNIMLRKFTLNPYDNLDLAYEIQMKILERIILIEKEIISNKETLKNNKIITHDKSTPQEKRKKLGIKNNNLKKINIMLKENMKEIRSYGDSIAFTYFNKYYLKPLCWKNSAGFINGKEGLKKELEVFDSYFKKGEFAILNDITNSLKYGDITVNNDGKPHLIEIKSSAFVDARVHRQREGLHEKLKIINNDSIDNLDENGLHFKRVHSKENEVDYINLLQNLINEALLSGEAIKEVEQGLLYVIEYNINQKNESTKVKNIKQAVSTLKKPHEIVLNLFNGVEDNFTPFPLLIKNHVALEEFNYGNLLIITYIDIEIVGNKLKSMGYNLKSFNHDGLIIEFDMKGKKIDMNVGFHHTSRLGREFISLEWFIKSIDDTIKNVQETL